MPWYRQGTVSVVQNSNAVTGSGTSFIANSRVGDAFRGPDGGWYEVTNIASDTAMSISPNYQGATVGAGIYALAPMQGYVKESADALRSLVNQFGGVLAVLGGDPTLAGVRSALNLADTGGLNEGLNKYYTDARVRATVLSGLVINDASAVTAADALLVAIGKLQAQASAKAASGANSDITSLSALTTALSIGQGGTGVKTMSALLSALTTAGGYAKSNILGIVAQASGLPTGAVIETGTTANGTYTKWADGTMIAHRKVNFALTPGAAFAYIFLTALQTATAMPVTFIGVPDIDMLCTLSNGYSGSGWLVGVGEPTTSTWPGFYIADAASRGITSFNVHFTAKGRWF